MKNVLFLFFTCLIAGCSSSSEPSAVEVFAASNGKIKVLSTTGIIDDIVGEIGGSRIDHLALIGGEIDPHNYELVKGDDEKLSLAQVIFYNGLGLEHGASLRYQLEHHSNALSIGEAILKKYPEKIIQIGREIDPHLWMDIALWTKMIDPVVDTLSKMDPAGEGEYRSNGEVVKTKMLQQHEKIYHTLQSVPQERRYLVSSHDAFNYFARAYLATPEEKTFAEWKKRFDAPEGLSPEGQLSVSHIQEIVNHLIKYQIQVVFSESNVSRDSLKKVIQVCARKGLEVSISKDVLYGDAMGPADSDANTYLKMMHYDAAVLSQTWSGNGE